MKEFRNTKGWTEHYSSLEELRAAFGKDPVKKRTDDVEKLKAQQEKFAGTCKVCKQPLSYISGSNILACKNELCKGIKMTAKNEDGTDRIWYIPVYRMLNEKGSQIAESLFN